MQILDPMSAAYEAEKRHARLSTPWELCHEASKIRRGDLRVADEARADRIRRGELERQEQRTRGISARAPRSSSYFHSRPRALLPLDPPETGRALDELVTRRCSVAAFAERPITVQSLSLLLRSAAGITHVHPVSGSPLRSAPASGALYELELYVAASSVEGLEAGLYHYHAGSHTLARLGDAAVLGRLRAAAVVPALVGRAAAYFVFTSVIGRLEWKYAGRSYRFTLLNAGHAAQQICLAATSLDLAACPHGGFVDDELSAALGVDGISELVVHSVCVGAAERPEPATPAAVDATAADRRRRLRRFDAFLLPPQYANWSALERLARAAVRAADAPRNVEGREAFLLLRAMLPGDRTVRDYGRYLEDPAVDLEAGDCAVYAFPASWHEAKRAAWREGVDAAVERICRWLGVESVPLAFLDLAVSAVAPRTDNRCRWLHRRVTFPAGLLAGRRPDPAVLVHELTHAAYLPHNRLIAEGVAGAVGFAEGDTGPLMAELRSLITAPPLAAWVFGEKKPPLPEDVLPAFAAALVEGLCRRRGREVFLRWTDAFLYPATRGERADAALVFERSFGAPPETVLEEWWACG